MMRHGIRGLLLIATLIGGCASHRPPAPAPDGRIPAADDQVGSVAANLWYVPGRALVCGASAISAGIVMIVTLGQSYDDASELMHGGCGGPWLVRPSDIRQAVP